MKRTLSIIFTSVLLLLLCSTGAMAQTALLDSLTLDTLTAYTSITEAMKNPEQVIKLELRKAKLKAFPPEILQMKNLQYLDLSKNSIRELPHEIGELKNLQYLSVARNKLEDFPMELGELTNLYYLNANNNNLSSLPSSIGNLVNLKNMDLWSNYIETFPTEIKNLKYLQFLDLRIIVISDAEQNRLQGLLPSTKIEFSPYCKCQQ